MRKLLPSLIAIVILSVPLCVMAEGTPVQIWLTTADQHHLLSQQSDLSFRDQQAASIDVVVDSTKTFQTMEGVGAAMTDASAILLQQKMPAALRQKVMAELFGRDNQGLGFDFTRITIGASDFSDAHYTLDDVPPNTSDETLQHFSMEPQSLYVMPALQQALTLNPSLKIMATPWSAPAWMKTNHHLYQGELNPVFYDAYAHYFLRTIESYQMHGVPIFSISVQNEPHFEPKDYPGMRFNPEDRARFIGRYLGPLFAQHKVTTKIWDWDHNWDQPESPLKVLSDPQAASYITGVAWHCYAGNASAQSIVHHQFPTKETWLTECSGGEWSPDWESSLPWLESNLIIDSIRHWSKGVLMWNLILDQHFGPHLGGCANCRAVMTYNTETGALTRNAEYYAFGHISKFVHRGAKRIASSDQTEGVNNVAFINEDGSIVIVLCNTSTTPHNVSVRSGTQRFAYQLPPKSVITAVWK